MAAALVRVTSEVEKMWTDALSSQRCNEGNMRALLERVMDELATSRARQERDDGFAESSRVRHECLLTVMQSLPSQVSALWKDAVADRDSEARGALLATLTEVRSRLEERGHGEDAAVEAVDRLRSEVERMSAEERERGKEQRCVLQQQMSQVPLVVKGVLSDMAKEIESQWTQTRLTTNATLQQMAKVESDVAGATTALAVQKKMVEDITNKLEALTQQMSRASTSLRAKGRQGENGLHDLLYDELCRRRDGYSVQMVNGHAHGCDINISRIGHADVRVESKAHGEGTGEKVRTSEVEKFKRDLMGLNAHGIFVSLHSGIVGKGEVEFEQLSNGKFAVFLSNNRYDVGIMHDMVKTMHMLDRLFADARGEREEGENACVRVPRETMRRVQDYLRDFARRVSETKTHLKDSMALLSGLAFDQLESLLLGGGIQPVKDAKDKKGAESLQEAGMDEACTALTIKCKWCDKRMGVTQRGPMAMHEKKCKSMREALSHSDH